MERTTTSSTTPSSSRQELIKAELSSQHQSLTKSDRELLKTFLGFEGIQGGRERTRREEDACLFVKNCLFPKKEEEGEEEEEEEGSYNFDDNNDNNINKSGQGQLFPLDEVMDYVTKFPSIFPNDEKSIKEFLETGGLQLGDRSMCAVIRSFQVSLNQSINQSINQPIHKSITRNGSSLSLSLAFAHAHAHTRTRPCTHTLN